MREATEAEYVEAGAQAHHDGYETVRCSGKRYFSITTKFCGVEVRAKHETMTRGKVTGVTYLVNPEYIAQKTEAS